MNICLAIYQGNDENRSDALHGSQEEGTIQNKNKILAIYMQCKVRKTRCKGYLEADEFKTKFSWSYGPFGIISK